ncbi:hypothetical protein [Asaia spathodeae]|uniref:DUF2946 domain-containing protein n=1 Tax=Asaia spathodeae TaxID=657016 RepID=A0ABX2P641_9PROT|nr:hypothetical protein [Asaia spathodeae]
MNRPRHPFWIVVLMIFFLVLRGITPVQASESGCASMSPAHGLSAAAFKSGCSGHHEAPVPGHEHGHACGSCLPSSSCISSFDAPVSGALSTPRLIYAARFEPVLPPALSGRRAPPDLRPPRVS